MGGRPQPWPKNEPLSPQESALYNECFPHTPGGVNAFAEALGGTDRCAQLANACLFEPARECVHLSRNHAYYLLSTGLMEVLRRPEKQARARRDRRRSLCQRPKRGPRPTLASSSDHAALCIAIVSLLADTATDTLPRAPPAAAATAATAALKMTHRPPVGRAVIRGES